jgi:hypothetical protein
MIAGLKDQVAQLSEVEMQSFKEKTFCKRALAAAKFFGSSVEVDLWTVAEYYINIYKHTVSWSFTNLIPKIIFSVKK